MSLPDFWSINSTTQKIDAYLVKPSRYYAVKSSKKSSKVPFGVRWRHYNSSGKDPSFFGDGKFLTKIFANLRRREHLPNHKKMTIKSPSTEYVNNIGEPSNSGTQKIHQKMVDSSSIKASAKCIFQKSSMHFRKRNHYFYLSLFSGSIIKQATFLFSLLQRPSYPSLQTPRGWAKSSYGSGVRSREWQWRCLAVKGATAVVDPCWPPGVWRGFLSDFLEKTWGWFLLKKQKVFFWASGWFNIPQVFGPADWELISTWFSSLST